MSSAPAGHLSVAVVDDEPGQRRLLREALEDAGYHVLEASDGESAIALANGNSLDAMILDVRMPGMGGLEALKIIKSSMLKNSIPC